MLSTLRGHYCASISLCFFSGTFYFVYLLLNYSDTFKSVQPKKENKYGIMIVFRNVKNLTNLYLPFECTFGNELE